MDVTKIAFNQFIGLKIFDKSGYLLMLNNHMAKKKSTSILFNSVKNNNEYNTSYPLTPSQWAKFKVDKDFDLFKDEKDFSIYIQIPFCENFCKFCEHTILKKNKDYEQEYLDILEQDIAKFNDSNSGMLHGFDIGGGTPTSLEPESFKRLMKIAVKTVAVYPKTDDYEPSIEASFRTLDGEKLKYIKEAGFNRISLGVQTVNTKILEACARGISQLDQMKECMDLISKHGISKRNLDFMYGLPGQTEQDIENAIEAIEILYPEHVTLYEMRYNNIQRESENTYTKQELYNQYDQHYNALRSLGYHARFGQNTFSRVNDMGLSSYIKHRMMNDVSYKGFGIAAQSKSKTGLSYNIGKTHKEDIGCSSKEISAKYFSEGTFEHGDKYLLPKDEMVAKYFALSMYLGEADIKIMDGIACCSFLDKFKDEIDFLMKNKLIEVKNNQHNTVLRLTTKGFKYYGGVVSMFYSNDAKEIVASKTNN